MTSRRERALHLTHLPSALHRNNAVLGRPERRTKYLDFTLGALDTNVRARSTLFVWVTRDTNVGHCDAVGAARGLGVGGRAGGEVEDDGGGFVSASEVVGGHLGGDGWWFALVFGESMVEGLEDPSKRVDAHWGGEVSHERSQS